MKGEFLKEKVEASNNSFTFGPKQKQAIETLLTKREEESDRKAKGKKANAFVSRLNYTNSSAKLHSVLPSHLSNSNGRYCREIEKLSRGIPQGIHYLDHLSQDKRRIRYEVGAYSHLCCRMEEPQAGERFLAELRFPCWIIAPYVPTSGSPADRSYSYRKN